MEEEPHERIRAVDGVRMEAKKATMMMRKISMYANGGNSS
jgi:hypothetical protein